MTKDISSSQKEVRFASESDNEEIAVPHRRQISTKQRAKIWLSANEYTAINDDARRVIAVMDDYGDSDGNDHGTGFLRHGERQVPSSSISSQPHRRHSSSLVTRGLESKTLHGAREKKIVVLDGLCAVLLEQEQQRQQGRCDPEDIRAAYLGYSFDAAVAAAKKGLQDAAAHCVDTRSLLTPPGSSAWPCVPGVGGKHALHNADSASNIGRVDKNMISDPNNHSPSPPASPTGSRSPCAKSRSMVKRLLVGRNNQWRNGSRERLVRVSPTF